MVTRKRQQLRLMSQYDSEKAQHGFGTYCPTLFTDNNCCSEELSIDRHRCWRHDPVTARAISRLSRQVAHLNAGTSKDLSRQAIRTKRCKSSNKAVLVSKNKICHGQYMIKDNAKISTDQMKTSTTGSKRKWQYDKSICVESSVDISTDSIKAQPLFMLDASDDVLLMEHSETVCSPYSVLSITDLSDNNTESSSDSPHSHEADVDEPDIEESVGCRQLPTPTDQSDGSSFPVRMNSICPSSNCYSNGDSSDGMSGSAKIPRTTTPLKLTSLCSSRKTKRNCDLTRNAVSLTNAFVDSVTQRSRRNRKEVRNRVSDGNVIDISEKLEPMDHDVTMHETVDCNCQAFANSTDSSSRKSTGSEEDLANDEQSDFPYDESLLPRKLSHPSLSYLDRRTPVGVMHKNAMDPASQKLSTSSDDLDAELNDILTGTWPLLSRQAKLGYVKGVAQAGTRHPMSGSRSRKQATTHFHGAPASTKNRKYDIAFVPSKLDHVIVNPVANHQLNDQKIRMPKPPWLFDDTTTTDIDNYESIDVDCLESMENNVKCSSSSSQQKHHQTATRHPGLGSLDPVLSKALPISNTNKGYQMLQKLGWEPDKGLGAETQGGLDPVGCSSFSQNKLSTLHR